MGPLTRHPADADILPHRSDEALHTADPSVIGWRALRPRVQVAGPGDRAQESRSTVRDRVLPGS
jgi:hypothetical protein